MSQVLMGIIGVILFIGLALAGALYFGEQFDTADDNSRAAALVQTVTQMANAHALYAVQEGKPLPQASAESIIVSSGYLKARSSPFTGAGLPGFTDLLDATGAYNPTSPDGVDDYVTIYMPLAHHSVCIAVNKQVKGTKTVPSAPEGNSGCFQPNGANRVVYVKL